MSPEELSALDQPPLQITEKIDRLMPLALEWYNHVEASLLPLGRPLTEMELLKARMFGVQNPEQVRIAVLGRFPMPEDPFLRQEAERFGLGSRAECGRLIGYVIMLKPHYSLSRTVIAHELVHISQHDRLGRAGFLRRYLIEMEMVGYERSPLEREAYDKQSLWGG